MPTSWGGGGSEKNKCDLLQKKHAKKTCEVDNALRLIFIN